MNNNLSVSEMSLEWLESVSSTVKPSTYAHYSFFVNNHIIKYFGNKYFQDITNKDIRTLIKDKSSKGRLDGNGGLSPSTLKCLIKVLKLICKYAEDMYNIPYCIKKVNLPKQKKKDIEIFTQDEQNKIIKYVMANLTLPNASILLSLYTGIRVGEICALSWSNIDIVNSTINIINTVQRIQKVGEDGNKGTQLILHSAKSNNSVRKIPIPSSFKDKILIPMYQKYVIGDNIPYFVTGKNKFSEPRYLQRHLAIVLDKCGIPKKNFHTLRHTFATNCIRIGFDVKTLSEILGHSDVSITLNTYVHSSFEVKQNFMNLLKK